MTAPATVRDPTARSSAWVVTPEQWARCTHEHTALLPDGTVELTWAADEPAPGTGPGCRPGSAAGAPRPGGLAVDDLCRAYRSRPGEGRVDVLAPGSAGRRVGDPGPALRPGVLEHPTGLAVDHLGRLYVAETGGHAVRVVDTTTGGLVARVVVDGHPLDVTPDCGHALALVRGGPAGRTGRLVVLDGRRGARPGPALTRPCYPPGAVPVRIASARRSEGPGCLLVLWRARDGRAAVATPNGTVLAEPDGATDLALGPDGRLVVARGRDGSFLDLQLTVGDGAVHATEREPLLAPGFDGGAVAFTPDGRVVYTTGAGYAWTAGSAARRTSSGSVVTYRLDSLAYRTRWGRLFVDACLPHGTSLALRCVTTDADDVLDPLAHEPPERGAPPLADPTATPPQAPRHLLATARRAAATVPYRRPDGPETPWPPPDRREQRFATYEMPVTAPPGRYLWVELVLTGTDRVSPTVRAFRVERPGHALLGALPRAWSRREEDADFLQRLLAPAEGMLHGLDQRAAGRASLVNPRSTPSDALDWLASLAALALDRRWSEEARRTLVAEAYTLFRRRGTLECLTRLLEIYLGHRPAVLEAWRLRGRTGAVLGTIPLGAPPETIGGAGSRSSGLGRYSTGNGSGAAHRFTVLVPGRLTPEQRAVVGDLLGGHRPAHTLGEICELGEGMRIGRSTRLALTTYVGPRTAAPAPAVYGRSGVGVDAALGGSGAGSRLEAVRVGEVRVG